MINTIKFFSFFLSSEDVEDNEAKLPAARVYPPADNHLLPMPPPVSSVLYGPLSALYIREAVCACREVTVSIAPIVDALVQVTFLYSERNNLCQNCLKCFFNIKILVYWLLVFQFPRQMFGYLQFGVWIRFRCI